MNILFFSFSKKNKENFIEFYNYQITENKVNAIKQALNKLDENFDEDVKMPKSSISFIICTVYRSIKDKNGTGKTINIIKDFLANYESNDEFKSYIKQETSARDSVNKQLEYWRNVMKSLWNE